jgi:hypothetical protein
VTAVFVYRVGGVEPLLQFGAFSGALSNGGFSGDYILLQLRTGIARNLKFFGKLLYLVPQLLDLTRSAPDGAKQCVKG